MTITVMRTKSFDKSLAELSRSGGNYKRATDEVFQALGRATVNSNPFEGMKLTKSGEQRISKCSKYDLNQYCRLITVQDKGHIFLLFAGTHKACDSWLENNRGLRVKVGKEMEPVVTYESADIRDADRRLEGRAKSFRDKLLSALPKQDIERLLTGIVPEAARKFEELSSLSDDEEILALLVDNVTHTGQRDAIFDVLMQLREGAIQLAEKRIRTYEGELRAIEELPEPEPVLRDSEDLQKIPLNSDQYRQLIEHFSRTAEYRDWMLFMHPDQESFVVEDYAGPTKLSGVSGSGKTCVVVKRAIRLAEQYPDDQVLVLTLNRSLASLIGVLVDTAAQESVRTRIEVLPYFSLCQQLLKEFEPENEKLYDDLTWKSKEHIDEIWTEYYRCELNNFDARTMQKVHDSLIARGIDAEAYIREEFDWIRSAVPPTCRREYLKVPRTGRAYPMDESFRTQLLKGLDFWENKMRAIGITDYLGLSTALYRHIKEINPKYRSILVDECQDFGTIELEVVRRLARPAENDIFLVGDAAQQVSSKHQDFKSSGLEVPGARSKRLLRNYRNSREILKAAYKVLVENLEAETIDYKEFDVLDPKHSYFNGPDPLVLKGTSLAEEIGCAVYFLKQELREQANMKACIVFCGHTLLELQKFGDRYGLPVLDGTRGIEDGNMFVADLESIKGFEFQYVCILNCSSVVIPYPGSPQGEQFRDLARLYVAMTRARTQLVISFSGQLSRLVKGATDCFLEDEWLAYLCIAAQVLENFEAPPKLDQLRRADHDIRFGDMTGEQFLYSAAAIGLESSLIEKIRKLISGRRRTVSGRREEWRDFADAAADIRTSPTARKLFGKDLEPFLNLLDEHLA